MNSVPKFSGNAWSEEDIGQLQDLLSAGVPPKDIAGRLGLSESTVETKMRELGVATVRGWTVWFTGWQHGGSWDDSWKAERRLKNGGHIHYYARNSRTLATPPDAPDHAIDQASSWVENQGLRTQP